MNADAQINHVTKSWKRVKLGDVLEVIRGASPRPKGDPRYFGGKIPWIMIADVTKEKGKYLTETREHVTEEGAKKSRYLKAGTLILSNSATVCVPKILKVDGCIHDGFVAFPNPPHDIDINYLYYFFEYVRPQIINENRQGITQVNLNTGIVKDIDLVLAPPNEQKLLVAEIEKQFSRLDEAVAGLKRVKANLKRYKAAVLKAAVEGQLTEEWRLAHPEVTPASELLTKILSTRRKIYERTFTGKKYQEPKQSKDGNMKKLPDTWVWATSDQLTSYVTSGSRDWKQYYSNKGALFIRTQDINTNRLELDNIAHVDLPDSVEGKRSLVVQNDILVIITGANVGKVAVVEKILPEAYVSQSVGLMKIVDSQVASYLHLAMIAADDGKTQLEKMAYGLGRPVLSLDNLRDMDIPLPPKDEQRIIVGEVERRFSLVSDIESQVNTNLLRADRMRQAILAAAFSSRLLKYNA